MSTTAKFFLLWKEIKKSWRGAESMSFTTPTTQDTRTRFINPEVLSVMKYWPDVARKAEVETAAMCALSCSLTATAWATGSEQGDAELGCHLPHPKAPLSFLLLEEQPPSHYTA